LPLVLWDCTYNESDISWQIDEADEERDDSQSTGGLYRRLRSIHERSVIHTTLDAYFLDTIAKYHLPPPDVFPPDSPMIENCGRTLSLSLGGGTYQRTSKYVPLLQRKRMENVEAVNERWRLGKGARKNNTNSIK